MSKKIHTIQSSDKKEFDKKVNFFLELGAELHDGGYEVIKNDDGVVYSQVVVFDDDKYGVDFHDNEQIAYLCNNNRPMEGKEISWYENGQKKFEITWKDGKRDGKWTDWYENGQIEIDAKYKNGLLDGLCTTWHENGNKKMEGKFKESPDDESDIYAPGTIIDQSWGRDGTWSFWNSDGQLYRKVEYKESFFHGQFTEWYENGNKKIEGECIGGQGDNGGY